jgi:sortase A
VSTHQPPPLSASEELRSGYVLEHPKPVPPPEPTPPGVRPPLSPARSMVVTTLATLSVLAVWVVLYALFFSGLQESHDQHVMYSQLRQNLALATVPIGGVITPGTPIGLISAPSIKLHSVVVEGTSSQDLTKGPGHYPSSPLPGQAGISQIFGRSATFGSPFGSVDTLHAGAPITVTTGQGVFTYSVIDVRRAGDPIPGVLATNPASLILETSAGSGWRSGWAPTQIVYVDASLSGGKIQPTPAGRLATSPSIDVALAGDTADLVPLVLWLQALILLSAGFAYAHSRWSLWQLWIVGVPAAVAVLWGTTSAALLLLPNIA